MKTFVRLLVSLVAIGWATSSGATLTLEPVVNSTPGSGPTANSFPLYDPVSVNTRNWRACLAGKPTWRNRYRFDWQSA